MEYIKNIDKNIFRGNDIRGKYPEQINEEVAYTIARGFATKIKRAGMTKCIVARDVRFSSPHIQASIIKGILETGVDVINLGRITTPMYYYSLIFLGIESGIMVTASHNPKDDNGLKFQFDDRGNACGDEIQEFREFIEKEDLENGDGHLYVYDITKDYLNLFRNSLNTGDRKLKVVVDLANATTCVIAKEIFDLFPNIEVVWLYDHVDPRFPNHHPDPFVESNLEELKRLVLEHHADLGVSYDGDGDRLGIVDEDANYIEADELMIIFIRDLIDKVKNKTFLYDVKCSKKLSDEIKRLGAKEIINRTGNSYLKRALKENNLEFCGEYSGHIFFNDRFPGFDSGIYASLRLIELLSKTDKKLSELLEGVEEYYSTPEIKIPSSDDKKALVVEKVKEYAKSKNYNIIDVDGVRVEFDDSWGLVRKSNTGPNLTLRFEAKTEDRLEEIKAEFINQVEKYNK